MRRWRPLTAVLALFLRERGAALLLGAGLSGLTALAGIALLGLSGWFITATALAGATAAGALAFDVFRPSAGIRLLAIVRTAGRYGERLATHDVTLGILASLRERLFRGYAAAGAARELAARPARLLFRLTVEVDALDSLYLRVLVPGATALLAAVAAGLGLGLMDWRLGLGLGLVLAVVGFGLPPALARAAVRPARRRAAALEALRMRSIDLVAGQVDLLMTGRLTAQRRAVEAADRRLAAAEDDLNRLDTGAAFGFGAAGAVVLSGTLLAAAALVQEGRLTAPQAALAVLVGFAALEPFAALRRGTLELGRTLLAARRLSAPLAAAPAVTAAGEPPPGMAAILENVVFRHEGAPKPLFDGLTLRVAQGERVAVTGPSGAGKSTLLDLLTGEAAPLGGVVLTRQRAVLGQRSDLFQDTLRGNLLIAAPGADETQLRHALERAGLGDVVRHLPRGLDTMLGEGGSGLSAGQRRRLALARLFLRDAPLWLLDEPTEGLDGSIARDVLTKVNETSARKAILVVTHLRREAEMADRLIRIVDGRVAADLRRGEPGFRQALDALRPD